MKTLCISAILAALLLVTALLMLPANAYARTPSSAAHAFDGEALAIVVNKSNPVNDISFTDLRKIFLAEQRSWPNNRKITLVMREPGQIERSVVMRLIYHMSESAFQRFFLQAKFTGDVQAAPKTLATASGMCKFVFNVPGAIGYVRAGEIDGSVKVLRVDGRAPGEPGYRLRLEAR